MGHTFPSPKQKQNNDEITYDKAVLELKVTRDRLNKQKQRIEQDNEKSIELAKKLLKEGKKERAKLVIKSKISREEMLNKVDGMLEMVQAQLNKLEEATVNRMVADSFKNTNIILKKMTEEMSADKIEALMDENEEQNEKLKEIASLLGQNMSEECQQTAEEEYERMLAEFENGNEQPAVNAEENTTDAEKETSNENPQPIAALA